MIREFALPLKLSEDGRSVFGRIFPFNEIAHIRELDAHGDVDEYDEGFLPGCTQRMRQVARQRGGSPAWIRFTLDHERAFDHRIGFCAQLDEDGDGANATFKLYDDPVRIDKLRSMLADSHNGLSIEFDDVVPPTINGSLRLHRQINVGAVTATPIPVYTSARVLAVREATDPLDAGTPNLDRVRAMLGQP